MRRRGIPRAARWSPVRHAWGAAWGHRRGQALALVAISALVTACTAFAPVYDRIMQQALVDTLLAQATPAERTVTVLSESRVFAGSALEARDPRALEALFPDAVDVRLAPAVLGRTATVTPAGGAVPPAGLLVWREDACEHVRVLSGRCPAGAGEILVSEADVENFRLDIGSTRTVNPGIEGEPGVRLEVVGTYAPSDEEWWQGTRLVGISNVFPGLDPSANHDAWLTTEETFADAPILTRETSQAGAPLLVATTGVEEVIALGDEQRTMARDLRTMAEDLQVDSGLDELADDVRSQVRQAHRTVPLLVAPMAVLSIYVLWLVLSAATAQRRGEVAVARLRGRGPAGAAALLLLELLPALVVGVVPGAAVALAGGAVAAAVLPGDTPFEVAPGFAATVLIAVSALVLAALAAAVRTAREPVHDVIRSGPVPSRRWALGAPDAFVVACAATGVLAFVSGSLQGPLALAGPALLALLAGLLLAHMTVPVASATGRRLLRRGRLVSGVSLLETGRRRETRAVVAVITVASALAVFSIDALVIGERNRVNASEHDAGAPVVLGVAGRDLDAVRAALDAADPTGHRATPVLLARDTLAVEPAEFSRIAFFPRGAPTPAQWRAIAPPDHEPVVLRGARFSLDVTSGDELTAADVFGSDVEVNLALVVTPSTGARHTIALGPLPPPGASRTLVGKSAECAGGCRLAAVQLTTAQGVVIGGDLELTDLRADGKPVEWGTSAEDWNPTEEESTLILPLDTGTSGVLHLQLAVSGLFPVELRPSWVPRTVPALLPTKPEDPLGLVVTGVDGTDRPAEAVGRVVLLPAMPRRSALVDLDAVTRGQDITFDTRTEVWLVDDPELVEAVVAALGDRGIAVTDVRRYATIRQSYEDTVASWSLALGAAVAPAVMLLALLVLLVLAVIGWRSRARDLAILRLNGAGPRTTRRLAVWAQPPAVLVGIVGGVAAGLAGALLAMPDVSFLPSPPETPVVDVATSWPAVTWVAAVCLVVLPSVAALAGLAVARRADLERARESS